jgi:hypothetical protein
MPDLSAINHRRLAAALVRMVLGRLGVHAFPERSLWLNLIRLVDQSISDYQQARLYAKERDVNAASFITNRSFMAMERMEQAILAACRASRFSLTWWRSRSYLHRSHYLRQTPTVWPVSGTLSNTKKNEC